MKFESHDVQRKQYKNYCIDKIKIVTFKERKDIKNIEKRFEIDWCDINYLNAETIRDIYNSLDSSNVALKECYLEMLFNILNYCDSDTIEIWWYNGVTAVIFFWLCKIWLTSDAIYFLCDNDNNSIATVLEILYLILEADINYFSSDDLWIIQLKIKSLWDWFGVDFNVLKEEIDDKITELRFKEIRQTIQSNNIEINNDKKQVIELLKNFWFEEKYNITLNKIDKFIANEDYNETVIPGWVIWIFREFFNDFYIDLATKIAKLNLEESIPTHKDCKTLICYAVKYIQQEFELWEDDTKLLWSYLWITNWEGSHKLVSEKKYFRLTRNIWIEIALLMLSKFEDYKKKFESN